MLSVADQITSLLDRYPATAYVRADKQPKKSGGTRPIAKPNKELKKWLKQMNKLLNKQFPDWPEFMHGGIKKRSYVTYARPHVGKQCVITVDIKSCFDTITEQEVLAAIKQHLGLTDDVSDSLAARLCFRGKIPQGFPTSNFVCNLYLLNTLTALDESFKRQRLAFGNYVDDLVVSGIIADPSSVVNEVAVALSRAKLKTNKVKVEVMPKHVRQTVCGLLVNKRLSLTRELKSRLLSDIAKHEMGEASLAGWLINLKNVDVTFAQKLRNFATKRGYD